MINFNQISNDLVASKVAIELNSKVSALSAAIIPQKILIMGQYDNTKTVVDYVPHELTGGLQEVKNTYGYGSMLALMVDKAIANAGSSIPIFVSPVPDDGAAVVATGTITVTGTASTSGVLYFYIAGQKVAVAVAKDEVFGDIASAIETAVNANADLPVTASATLGVVTLTANWKGLTGNDITIEQNLGGIDESSSAPSDVTIVIVGMASGATNPDITDVFQYLEGSDWFTVLVNPYTDVANLTILETKAEALADPLIKRFPNTLTGDTTILATAEALADSRNSRFNTLVHVDSSPSFPAEVGAATAGQIAKSAGIDPARPFKNLILVGILPGNKLSYSQIDQAEKKGLGETDVTADGRVKIYDLVTTYKTNGEGAPDTSYRYTVTISNLQAKIYTLDVVLSSEPFTRAKVVDDDTVTSQEYAISPKVLKGFIIEVVDKIWIANVWSINRDEIVDSIQAEINATNPSRLDVSFIDILASGLRILAVKYGFAFSPVE